MKKSIGGILSVLCLLLLLFNPSLALTGARQGLLLWADVVLPTLLPFMICSGIIVALDAIPILTGPFSPFLSGFLGLSGQGSFVFMSGLLCGYPMGAKTASDFLDSGRISREEGQYLLAISNHPSPMFILGYVMAQIRAVSGLSPECPPWAVAAALYLPVIPISMAARPIYHAGRPAQASANGKFHKSLRSQSAFSQPFSFDEHLMSCFETMVKIGGYIMIFSILAVYLAVLPLPFQGTFPASVSPFVRPALLGAVEITTGIQAIASSVPGRTGAVLIVASAAFGGFSGIFQTKSVLKNAGLSIRHYTLWKCAHCALSCLFLSYFMSSL